MYNNDILWQLGWDEKNNPFQTMCLYAQGKQRYIEIC